MQNQNSTTALWQLLVFLLDEECATSLPDCLKATRIIERERPRFEAIYRNHQLARETQAGCAAGTATPPIDSRKSAARSQAPLPASPAPAAV